MQSNLRAIAAFAIVITLAAIVLFIPTHSVSATPPQSGGGLSITFGVGQKPDAPYTVTCESRSHRRTYCAADTRGGATLQQHFPAARRASSETLGEPMPKAFGWRAAVAELLS